MSLFIDKKTSLTEGIARLRQQLREVENQLNWLENELKSQAENSGGDGTESSKASSFDLLSMPDWEGAVFSQVSRRGRVNVAEVATALNQNVSQTEATMVSLTTRGLLYETFQNGVTYYELASLPRQKRELPADLWDLLESRIS